jgi:hypothetical protein
MNWRWAVFGVVVALAGSFGRPSVAASSAPAGALPRSRVVHVCDCPASMAEEERTDLLRFFAKLGDAQGRDLEPCRARSRTDVPAVVPPARKPGRREVERRARGIMRP